MDVYAKHAIIRPPTPPAVVDYDASDLTVAEILAEYSDGYSRPVVIRGLFKHVPAIEKWQDPDYFTKCCGDDSYLALIDGRMIAMSTGPLLSACRRRCKTLGPTHLNACG
jgi:hypothetical protein